MDRIKHSRLFKCISFVLIITFLTLDIAYAYPPEHNVGDSTLAVPSLLQQPPINEQQARFQQSFLSQSAIIALVYAVGEYYFGNVSGGLGPLPSGHLFEVISSDLEKQLTDTGITILNIVPVEYIKNKESLEKLKLALDEIGFEGNLPDKGVVFILYEKDNERFLMQIAKKPRVSADNLPGYEWYDISDKYLVKYVPEDYTGTSSQTVETPSAPVAQELTTVKMKESPKVTISEPIAEVSAQEKKHTPNSSSKLLSFNPFAITFGTIMFTEVLSAIKDLIFAYPIIVGITGVVGAVALFFAIWKKLDSLNYNLYKLGGNNVDARTDAVKALSNHRDKTVVRALIKALGDNTWRVRAKAAAALGGIGDSEAVPALINALTDTDSDVRSSAVNALTKIGSPAVPALINLLKDTNSELRKRAEIILGKMGPSAIPDFIKALDDEDLYVSTVIMNALKNISFSNPSEVIRPLTDILVNSKNDYARIHAVQNIGHMDHITPEVILSLTMALKDRNANVRNYAAHILKDMHTGAGSAVPALIESVLTDEDPGVRMRAIRALGAIQMFTPEVVAAIVKAVEDKNDDVRRAAMEVFGKMGSKAVAAMPALNEALKDKVSAVRPRAKIALKKIQSNGSTTMYFLNPFAIGFSAIILTDVFSALMYFASTHPIITSVVGIWSVAGVLFTIWKETDPVNYNLWKLSSNNADTRVSAAIALGDPRNRSAVPYLTGRFYFDENDRVRTASAEALNRIGYNSAISGAGYAQKKKQKAETLTPSTSPRPAASNTTKLFEIVASLLNSRRTIFINAGNELSNSLIAKSVLEINIDIRALNNDMTSYEITRRVARTLTTVNSLEKYGVSRSIGDKINYLKSNIGQIEADGAMAALIVMARNAKKENQKIIIGLEADSIPGVDVRGSLQHDAISALMKEICSIGDALKSKGLDNVEIVRGSGSDLAASIIDRANITHTSLRNVVVMASIQTITSNSFSALRDAKSGEKPFLAGIDWSELIEFYSRHNESIEKQLRIRFAGLLYMTLELAAGKEPPQASVITSYKRNDRLVFFLPKAESVEYGALRRIYEGDRKALEAA